MKFTNLAALRATICLAVFLATFCILIEQSEGEDDLVGYWKFDEGAGNVAEDSVGDHDGEFVGSPTWVDGEVGTGALSVDGTNYVNCGTWATEEPDLTVAFWMNTPTHGHKRPIAVSSDDYLEGPGWMVMLRIDAPPGGVWFRIHGVEGDWNGGDLQINETVYEPNEWVHMAFTFDSESHEINGYINGELKDPSPITAGADRSVANMEDDLRFGNTGTGENYDGMLDDIQIYNRPLTQEEVEQAMEGAVHAVAPSGKLTTTWADIKK